VLSSEAVKIGLMGCGTVGPAANHVHRYNGLTSVDADHSHSYRGRTGRPRRPSLGEQPQPRP
jgi:hypothetical protein